MNNEVNMEKLSALRTGLIKHPFPARPRFDPRIGGQLLKQYQSLEKKRTLNAQYNYGEDSFVAMHSTWHPRTGFALIIKRLDEKELWTAGDVFDPIINASSGQLARDLSFIQAIFWRRGNIHWTFAASLSPKFKNVRFMTFQANEDDKPEELFTLNSVRAGGFHNIYVRDVPPGLRILCEGYTEDSLNKLSDPSAVGKLEADTAILLKTFLLGED